MLKNVPFTHTPPGKAPLMIRSTRSLIASARRALAAPLAAIAGASITATAQAHPGHGVTPQGDSVAHYLLEPMHGLGIVAILAATVVSLLVIRSRRTART
jgi:hypothetical protein